LLPCGRQSLGEMIFFPSVVSRNLLENTISISQESILVHHCFSGYRCPPQWPSVRIARTPEKEAKGTVLNRKESCCPALGRLLSS
jgi:hypothetical protein